MQAARVDSVVTGVDDTEREFTRKSLAVLAACSLSVMLNGVALAIFPFSVFMQPLMEELGWSRVQLSTGATLCWIGVAVSAPIGGLLVARYGPRPIAITSAMLYPLVFLALSRLDSASLPVFYAAFAMLGLLTPGVLPASAVIASWFDRHRAKAMSAIGIGGGIAKALMPWIAFSLIGVLGWRWAYGIFGMASLVLVLPALLVFFNVRTNSPLANLPAAVRRESAAEPGVVRAALRSKNFWLMILAEACAVFSFNAFLAHAVGMMTEHGFSRAFAVMVVSSVGIGGLLGPLAAGYLLDRYHTAKVMIPFAAMALIGVSVIHHSGSEWLILAVAPLIGIGISSETGFVSYFVTRYFGVRSFSQVYGVIIPAMYLAGAPGPLVAGKLFQLTGSYSWSLTVIEVACAISILSFCLLGPYSFKARDP